MLPLPALLSVTLALILVLIAAITTPLQRWIHVLNVVVSFFGVIIFGSVALRNRFAEASALPGAVFVTALAIIFLVALYFALRTLRSLAAHHRIHP
jgi:hypothetical protein